MEINELLEPAKLYKEQLKEKHHQNVCDAFDELVKKSNVDVGANELTCSRLHKEETNLKKANKRLAKLGGLLAFFIILIIVGVVGIIVGIFQIINGGDLAWLWLVVGALVFLLGIILVVKVYKPRKFSAADEAKKLTDLVKNLTEEAYSQMEPLNRLFDSSMSAKLFQKTCPLIEMDRIFDVNKYEMMREKYDMWDNSEKNVSTLDIQSGSILGNPFVIFKDLNMNMVEHVYTGSLTISYSVGSGQNRHMVTETLRATYSAPMPTYSKDTYLVYGNEAANRLSFSREPSKINSMNEKEIRDYVRKHEKDLDKIANKQLKKGGSYTPIGNPEFELFFGGLDRDDEVGFRVLFTALGQTSMMQLLKSKEGYGDDFFFKKIKGLNVIKSIHSQGNILFAKPSLFTNYEFATIKNFFINFNDTYFKSLFFDFAPLLAIPIYQQNKTHEYIYKNTVKSNVVPFEHEVLANLFAKIVPKNAKTDIILKTSLASTQGDTDIVNVTAHSFNVVPRIERVPVLGGNGRTYYVDVPWNEYIPVEAKTTIEVNDTGSDDEVKFKSLNANEVIYARGLVSKFGDNTNVDIKKIKAQMKRG